MADMVFTDELLKKFDELIKSIDGIDTKVSDGIKESLSKGEFNKAVKELTNARKNAPKANQKTIEKPDTKSPDRLRKELQDIFAKNSFKGSALKGLGDWSKSKSLDNMITQKAGPLGNAFGLLTKRLGVFNIALGVAAVTIGALTQSFVQTTGVLKHLNDNGMYFGNGLVDLADRAHALGMGFDDFAQLMVKYGPALSGDKLIKFQSAMDTTINSVDAAGKTFKSYAADFGLSIVEASEYLANYQSEQFASGRLAKLSAKTLANEAAMRMKSTVAWSQAMNVSTESILKTAEANRNNPIVKNAINSMTDAQKAAFGNFNTMISGLGPEIARPMTEMLAAPAIEMTGVFSGMMSAAMAPQMQMAKEMQQTIQAGNNVTSDSIKKFASSISSSQMELLTIMASSGDAEATQALEFVNAMKEAERRLTSKDPNQAEKNSALKAYANANNIMAKFSNIIDKMVSQIFTDSNTAALAKFIDTLTPFATAIADMIVNVGKIVGGATSILTGGASMETVKSTGLAFAKIAGVAIGAVIVGYLGKNLITGAAGMVRGGLGKAGSAMGGVLGSAKTVGDKPGMMDRVGKGLGALGSPAAIKGAATMGILSGTLWVVSEALENFDKINWSSLGKAAATLGGLALAAAGLGTVSPLIFSGSLAIAALGASILPLAFSMNVMAPAMPAMESMFTTFTSVDGSQLFEIAGGLGALTLSLGAFSAAMLVSTGTGMIEKFAGMFGVKSPMERLVSFSKEIRGDNLLNAANAFGIMGRNVSFLSSELKKSDLNSLGKLATVMPAKSTNAGLNRQITPMNTEPGKQVMLNTELAEMRKILNEMRDLNKRSLAEMTGINKNTKQRKDQNF